MIGVINASPLIYLGKLGVIRLLPQLFSEVWTSEEVKKEVLSQKATPEFPVLEEAFSTWLKIYSVKDTSLLTKLLKLNIHRGEAYVIMIAYELKHLKKEPIAIIDDLTAREIAVTFEIPVIGTVGVLLRGVKEIFLTKEKCKNLFEKLIEETDFRITTKLYSQILKKLEEF
ncbi:MAG: DUF3368 domain-containing protein [Candidatus Helarchaeota archaeon]|nr:DUF3368 domain-containing protein [Candidatus Helarchaeota archaeon]